MWDVAVSRNDRGWRAEFRIPFSQLRFPAAADSTFGLAIVREIGRLNETTTWPLLAKSATGYVSSFGELTGLQLGRSQKRLELVPYVVGDVKTQPVEDAQPAAGRGSGRRRVGVDLKYALKPGLTLTATVNPDFGQVEADPAVVNLSAFETFFSERRPFFVEGVGHLPVRPRLQRRQLQRPVLLAPHRPRAARRRRRSATAASPTRRRRRRSSARRS